MDIFSLDSKELLQYQPNRPPFLMIDYVSKVKPGEFAEGYKNLPHDEWFFPIHFPGNPNMPGALQLEALAQMLTVVPLHSQEIKAGLHMPSHMRLSLKKRYYQVENII